jgi:hypothetical protein
MAADSQAARLAESRIYIEYNETGNDLGFHVFLDGEDWKALKILNPKGVVIFDVVGRAGYAELGLTELFFEGAEPNLDEFPLAQLLAKFPEGRYKFVGTSIEGRSISSTGTLSHAVPRGPVVSTDVAEDGVVIRWEPVGSEPPDGFPDRTVQVVRYQVIVESLQVTLDGDATQLTLPEELVDELGAGEHPFEVLAIDVSGNQTITEGSFEIE